jgi:hypothetical protein
VAYFDLLGHDRPTRGSVPASNALTCPDDIFGKRRVRDLAPTTHVGNPPLGTVDAGNLAALAIVAIALVLVGFFAFRRRDVPRA